MSVGSSFRRNAYQRLERGGHAAVRDDDPPDGYSELTMDARAIEVSDMEDGR